MTRKEAARSLDILLREICVDLGFCNRLNGDDFVARSVLGAEEFAQAVMSAEGMNPEYEPKWRQQIQSKFIREFGHADIKLTDL